MAQEPLATRGNYLHIYDFRVMKGKEDEFIRLFEEFDYSDGNPMHKSSAQVKDGVLCRDTEDPQRFFLIAEWADIEEHAAKSWPTRSSRNSSNTSKATNSCRNMSRSSCRRRTRF
jgi:heme-degrading monooxygenase HmoA